MKIYVCMLCLLLQGCATNIHRFEVFGLTFYKGEPYVLVREEIGTASAPFYSHHVESRTDRYKMYVGSISRDAINAHRGVASLKEVASYPFGLSEAKLIGNDDSFLVILVTDKNWHCSDVIGMCQEYDIYDQYKNVTSISGSGKFYVDDDLYGFRNNALKKIGRLTEAVKYDKFAASSLSLDAKYIVISNNLVEISSGRAMAPVSLDKQCFQQVDGNSSGVSDVENIGGNAAVIYGQVFLPEKGNYFSGICFPVSNPGKVVWVDAKLTRPDTFSESYWAHDGIFYSAFVDDFVSPKKIILNSFNVLNGEISKSVIPISIDGSNGDGGVPVVLFRTSL